MMQRRAHKEPMVALLVLEAFERLDGLGERLPRDEAESLSVLKDALSSYIEEQRGDLTKEAAHRRELAKRLVGRVMVTQRLLAMRRQEYLNSLVAGTYVRADSVGETMKLTQERRDHEVRNVQGRA